MTDDPVWDLYWRLRLRDIEELGKAEAIREASRLVRTLGAGGAPARMLELGCGAGQVLGALVEAHGGVRGVDESVGVDLSSTLLARARDTHPALALVQGDYTDPTVLSGLGTFQIVLLVNTLHEVFSATCAGAGGEVDVPAGRAAVARTLSLATRRIAPGGHLLLFDGLEPPGDPERAIVVRFASPEARSEFRVFADEYRPFQIRPRWLPGGWHVELSQRDFVRYIDKAMFVRKALWEAERLESYQYFTQDDFRRELAAVGLTIDLLRTLTVSEHHWRRRVVIETPGVSFPDEHVLIVARRPSDSRVLSWRAPDGEDGDDPR